MRICLFLFQMSCGLNTIASVDELSRIRAFLLPHLLDTISDSDAGGTESDVIDDEDEISKFSMIKSD